MSSVTFHAPVLRHRWSVPSLYRTWRRRRRVEGIFVAILHMADLPPGA